MALYPDDLIVIDLTPGERTVLGHLMFNFSPGEGRTSSIMRKVKRVRRAIKSQEIEGLTIRDALDLKDTMECPMDKETLDWAIDIFGKFDKWPTHLDEWIDTVEEKMRLARLAAAGKKD